MLTIRAAQWKALTRVGLVRFEREMVRHLSDFAPQLAQAVGSEPIAGLVRLGVTRGAKHGFTDRGPLRMYLEMMLALGSDFDSDPALMRATRALRAAGLEQHKRARALYEDILEYWEKVNGLENQHLLAAMRRLHGVPYEALAGGGSFQERAVLVFRGGFPQKHLYAGEAALRDLAMSAARKGDEYEIRSEAGRILIALLQYLLGHGAFRDPVYRWMSQVMRDPALRDSEERARDLHRRTQSFVAALLKPLPPR